MNVDLLACGSIEYSFWGRSRLAKQQCTCQRPDTFYGSGITRVIPPKPYAAWRSFVPTLCKLVSRSAESLLATSLRTTAPAQKPVHQGNRGSPGSTRRLRQL